MTDSIGSGCCDSGCNAGVAIVVAVVMAIVVAIAALILLALLLSMLVLIVAERVRPFGAQFSQLVATSCFQFLAR